MRKSEKNVCYFCKKSINRPHLDPVLNSNKFECKRCGHYYFDKNTSVNILDEWTIRLAGYTRDQNAAGNIPLFTNELLDYVSKLPLPRLKDRATRLLAYIVQKVGIDSSNISKPHLSDEALAVSYSKNYSEVDVLIRILDADRLIHYHGNQNISILAKGFQEIEGIIGPSSASPQAFIAMSFSPSLKVAYALGFDPGVRAAGYSPLRIDDKEHVGSISDAILAEIRRSRFIVADYTDQNSGVYFEAGFSFGLGIPVIPTCREDQINDLHFDVRHINTLPWNDPTDLAQKLARRISAVMGDGPLQRVSLPS